MPRQVTNGLLAAIAAHRAVPGMSTQPMDARAMSESVWIDVIAALGRHRLSGLASAAVADGTLRVTDRQRLMLVALQRRWMATSLVRERVAIGLVRRFHAAGLPVVLLKGPSFAHRFYPDPCWRPFGDVDLLVRQQHWPRAVELLAANGFERVRPEPRKRFDVRFGKAALHRNGDGVEVDLHRTLVLGPFGLWMKPDELFEATSTLALGTTTIPCLDPTMSWVHACIHATLGSWPHQLHALRDVIQIERSGEVDWEQASEIVGRWQLGPVVRRTLEETARTLGVPSAGPDSLRTVPAVRRAERAIGAYAPPRRQRGGVARATVAAIPRTQDKAAYVLALALPRARFLRAREGGGGLAARLRRWGRAARGIHPSGRSW